MVLCLGYSAGHMPWDGFYDLRNYEDRQAITPRIWDNMLVIFLSRSNEYLSGIFAVICQFPFNVWTTSLHFVLQAGKAGVILDYVGKIPNVCGGQLLPRRFICNSPLTLCLHLPNNPTPAHELPLRCGPQQLSSLLTHCLLLIQKIKAPLLFACLNREVPIFSLSAYEIDMLYFICGR